MIISGGALAGWRRSLVSLGTAAAVLVVVGAGGISRPESVDAGAGERRELALPSRTEAPPASLPEPDTTPSRAIVPSEQTPSPRTPTPPPAPPAATSTPAPASGTRDAGPESALFADVNQRRAGQGLPPLSRASCADGVARGWTRQMMDSGRLSHNPGYQSQVGAACGPWSLVGENIAFGPSASWIGDELWRSSRHRANILGDFTRVGVGALRAPDGSVWATFNFYRSR